MRGGSEKPRVVLDTNVLLSALAFQGATRRVWELVETGLVDLFVSPFILEELHRNLILKAGLSRDNADLLVEEVFLQATIVRPETRISVIARKDSDNRILECAVAAGAHMLVTGNMKDLRPLGSYQGIAIVTPAEFLARWERP